MPERFFIDKERAELLFSQLGEALQEGGSDPIDILVCGGMALIMQDLVVRPTTDIDGIGCVVDEEGSLVLRSPDMQHAFRQARERVAAANELGNRWINFQSRTLIDNGLPEGILERALKSQYGPKLRIRLCSRVDIVALKMWAALDPKRDVDLKDLLSLKVKRDEAEFGARYCLGNQAEKNQVAKVLEAIGHDEMARELLR